MLRKSIYTALAIGMLTSPAMAQDITEQDVRDIVLETLTNNPELLVTALRTINEQQLQARADLEAREARIREIAANAAGAPVAGNPNGDITIVVFTDYNCAECRTANTALQTVVENDDNIRLVYRDLPVTNEGSAYAARAALAADAQGKYASFHNAIMAMDKEANVNTILSVALETGVDLNQMLVQIDNPEVSSLIEDTQNIAEEFGFEGTPTFFIGTTIASGEPTAAKLREIIAQERGS